MRMPGRAEGGWGGSTEPGTDGDEGPEAQVAGRATRFICPALLSRSERPAVSSHPRSSSSTPTCACPGGVFSLTLREPTTPFVLRSAPSRNHPPPVVPLPLSCSTPRSPCATSGARSAGRSTFARPRRCTKPTPPRLPFRPRLAGCRKFRERDALQTGSGDEGGERPRETVRKRSVQVQSGVCAYAWLRDCRPRHPRHPSASARGGRGCLAALPSGGARGGAGMRRAARRAPGRRPPRGRDGDRGAAIARHAYRGLPWPGKACQCQTTRGPRRQRADGAPLRRALTSAASANDGPQPRSDGHGGPAERHGDRE